MRVRYLADGQGLAVGREYPVLAISVRGDQGVYLMVLLDETQQPAWAPADQFDVVSDTVPTNWHIEVGVAGSTDRLEIRPGSWFEPGFLEAYWSDEPIAGSAARETFARELEVILRDA